MRRQQNGITFIGWLFLLVPVAIVGYAAIRLTPVYLNYMKVAKAMEQAATDFQGDEQVTPAAVHSALERRFDVDSINYPPVDSIVVRREGTNWTLYANYEDVVPLISNLSLLLKFEKNVVIQ
jgi:Domain of unknown function (DUF4845)